MKESPENLELDKKLSEIQIYHQNIEEEMKGLDNENQKINKKIKIINVEKSNFFFIT